MIYIANKQKELPLPPRAAIRSLVRVVLDYHDCKAEEVGVVFVSNREMCLLHEKFFGDPSPTDCISFPIDTFYLGDIFICPHTALVYASKKKVDPYQELTLYIVHALLHLLGYDDIGAVQRRRMRRRERIVMKKLAETGHVLTC